MTDSQKWLLLAFIVLLAGLFYLLSPILMPFVIAVTLAYLGDPVVDRLEMIQIRNWRLGRSPAVTLVFLSMILIAVSVLLIVIPGLESQIGLLLQKLPGYLSWLNNQLIPELNSRFDLALQPYDGERVVAVIKTNWRKAGGLFSTVVRSLSYSGGVILGWLMNLLLIPVITFYLLRDWDILVARVHDLFPRRIAPVMTRLASESDQVLGAFLRGQFYVMIALGVIYSTGLWLTGLELSLLIGMLAGMVSFVPYLGTIVGIVVACLAAMLQFQDLFYLLPVAIVFVVGQLLESMWLTPWLVGEQIGLHPVAVIFAVLAGGQLFGFLGVLMALPLASVTMVLLRYLHERYTESRFYSDQHK